MGVVGALRCPMIRATEGGKRPHSTPKHFTLYHEKRSPDRLRRRFRLRPSRACDHWHRSGSNGQRGDHGRQRDALRKPVGKVAQDRL